MAHGDLESDDAEINWVCVKVTYIVQRVGRRVHAIGQQARDPLKIKAERRLGTGHVPRGSVSRRSGPGTVSVTKNFLKANRAWLHRARPPSWSCLPGSTRRQKHALLAESGRHRGKPKRKLRLGGRRDPQDLHFTNYPACLRASLQTRKMDFKWLEKLNHEKNTDGKIDGVRNTHTIWN